MIQGYLKAKTAISIGIAALLCLGLIGCVAQESPTATPSDIPAFSEGEAIAIVQTLLMQSGCSGYYIALSDQSTWNEEYLGQGKWSVKWTEEYLVQGESSVKSISGLIATWMVFENSQSASLEEGEMLRC